jgi:hypothetical protein
MEKKLGRPKATITILRELRDQYVVKRDKIASRYEAGDMRQGSPYYKCELARANGHIEAISEAIDRLK